MGMQCTFNLDDVSQFPSETIHHKDSDTYSLRIDNPHHGAILVNLNVPENKQADGYFCWFDCGRGSFDQMMIIQWLIHNRIPFNCA